MIVVVVVVDHRFVQQWQLEYSKAVLLPKHTVLHQVPMVHVQVQLKLEVREGR